MSDARWIWPSASDDLWEISNQQDVVHVNWTGDLFEDYASLASKFYKCGYAVFDNVIESGHDNVKSDMWFLAAVFVLRQSIELGIKALLCRIVAKREVTGLFKVYNNILTEVSEKLQIIVSKMI